MINAQRSCRFAQTCPQRMRSGDRPDGCTVRDARECPKYYKSASRYYESTIQELERIEPASAMRIDA